MKVFVVTYLCPDESDTAVVAVRTTFELAVEAALEHLRAGDSEADLSEWTRTYDYWYSHTTDGMFIYYITEMECK